MNEVKKDDKLYLDWALEHDVVNKERVSAELFWIINVCEDRKKELNHIYLDFVNTSTDELANATPGIVEWINALRLSVEKSHAIGITHIREVLRDVTNSVGVSPKHKAYVDSCIDKI